MVDACCVVCWTVMVELFEAVAPGWLGMVRMGSCCRLLRLMWGRLQLHSYLDAIDELIIELCILNCGL